MNAIVFAGRSPLKYILPLLAGLLALIPHASFATERRVASADAIKPDLQLRDTLDRLRSLAASGREENIKSVEAYFASKTKTFRRGLDPFQPWKPGEALTRDYLEGAANVMVEQGEFEAGRPAPDYRLDAMKLLASLISQDATFGALPQMPGAVCSPAAYKVDRAAALAFARRFKLDAYSLRFFADDVFLAGAPESKQGERVPAKTLMMFDDIPGTPKGWDHAETVGGVKGYLEERDDALGLSQSHICFAKVKGSYRITAIFGYGL